MDSDMHCLKDSDNLMCDSFKDTHVTCSSTHTSPKVKADLYMSHSSSILAYIPLHDDSCVIVQYYLFYMHTCQPKSRLPSR